MLTRIALGLVTMLGALSASGQTTVTTTGGTANAIPKFSGSSAIVNSAFSETNGNLVWGCSTGQSFLDSDQGGALELGANNSGVNCTTNGTPYIDFHFGNGKAQDFNARIMNGADNRLDFFTNAGGLAPVFTINGTRLGVGNAAPTQALDVNGNIRVGSALVFSNGTSQTTASNLTGVFAGTGLTGGGNAGNVTLSVDGTVARTNGSDTFSGWLQANGAFSSFLGVNGAIIGQVPSGIAAWLANHNGVPGIGTGDIIQGHGVNNARVFRVDNVGSVFALNGYFTTGVDFAESVKVVGQRTEYEPGDVLAISGRANRRFELANKPYSTSVAGVYSTKPGITASPHPVMGLEQLGKEVPLAVVGIVPTKASTENGPIMAGDLLVTSSIPGYVMKGTDRELMLGAVIGKALEPLSSGLGKIQVLVTLQ